MGLTGKDPRRRMTRLLDAACLFRMMRLLGPPLELRPGDSSIRFLPWAFASFREMERLPRFRSFGEGVGEGGGVFSRSLISLSLSAARRVGAVSEPPVRLSARGPSTAEVTVAAWVSRLIFSDIVVVVVVMGAEAWLQ